MAYIYHNYIIVESSEQLLKTMFREISNAWMNPLNKILGYKKQDMELHSWYDLKSTINIDKHKHTK